MTPRNSSHTPQPSIELHIEELVLHGFAPGGRFSIGEAVERELTRLLAHHAPRSLLQDGELARLEGGGFEADSRSRAEVVGTLAARAVYEGLNQ